MKNDKRIMTVMTIAVMMALIPASAVFAATDPIEVVRNLSDFIFGMIREVYSVALYSSLIVRGSIGSKPRKSVTSV